VALSATGALAETVSLEAEEMSLEGFEVETDRWYQGGREQYVASCAPRRPGVATANFPRRGRFEFMIGIIKDRRGYPGLEVSVVGNGGRASRIVHVPRGHCGGEPEWISAGHYELNEGDEITIRGYANGGGCVKIDAIRFERVAGASGFTINDFAVTGDGDGCSGATVGSVDADSGAVVKAYLQKLEVSTSDSNGGRRSDNHKRGTCSVSTWIGHDCDDGVQLHDVSMDAFADIADVRGARGKADLVVRLDGGRPKRQHATFRRGHLGEREHAWERQRPEPVGAEKEFPWEYTYRYTSLLETEASVEVWGPDSFVEIGAVSSEITGALGCRREWHQ
jgi:hypothetical protein